MKKKKVDKKKLAIRVVCIVLAVLLAAGSILALVLELL